jgi:tetratricopeptide (TPR) repeat protein
MIKSSCLPALILLISCSMISIAYSQDQVSQTVYVYEGDFNGTLLSGVQVTGQDAAGKNFEGMTDSNGVLVLNGQPGTWQFKFTKEGYEPLDLSYDVTETDEGAVYLIRSDQSYEQISSSQNNLEPEVISETTRADRTQSGTDATSSELTGSYQEREIQNPTVPQKIETTEPETANAEFWLEKGNALYEQGRYNEASQVYDRAILLNPQLEASWFNKGKALYMQGSYDEALQVFDRAIEINPQDAIAWNCRGLTLIKLGHTVEAEAAFIRAKELGYMG